MNKELAYKIFVVIIGTGCMMVGPYFINFIVGKSIIRNWIIFTNYTNPKNKVI
jgi:hypothetical protein